VNNEDTREYTKPLLIIMWPILNVSDRPDGSVPVTTNFHKFLRS